MTAVEMYDSLRNFVGCRLRMDIIKKGKFGERVDDLCCCFILCCCSMFGGGKKADDPYLYDTLDPLQSYPFRHLPHYNLTIF